MSIRCVQYFEEVWIDSSVKKFKGAAAYNAATKYSVRVLYILSGKKRFGEVPVGQRKS